MSSENHNGDDEINEDWYSIDTKDKTIENLIAEVRNKIQKVLQGTNDKHSNKNYE